MKDLFHRADAADRIVAWARELGDGLAISERIPDAVSDETGELSALARDGYTALPDAADAATCAALVRVIGRLLDAGLPAVFAYLYDASWTLGERLRARVAARVGRPYRLASDGWAWRIPPGARGWSPHRDERDVYDRAAPARLNAWLALSDVEANRACLHVVPLDLDPNYPSDLQQIGAPAEATRPLPVRAGTALLWNANLLHWGGACAPDAAGARVAISYTFLSPELDLGARELVTPASLTPRARVDAIAQMIAIYEEERPPDVSEEVRSWAAATCALLALRR